MRQDNDVTNHTGAIYDKNETGLLLGTADYYIPKPWIM